MNLTIGTFNCENLFARYRFRTNLSPVADWTINQTAFELHDLDSKKLTAKVIKEMDADILCLQEVENMQVLERFNSRYLASMKYTERLIIEGNDPRGIDLAVLSRYPIVHSRSYRSYRLPDIRTKVFSRDCLTFDVIVNNKKLRVYNNHFKSMAGGRANTYQRRFKQAVAVNNILKEDWGNIKYKANFVVVGDLNDYPDHDTSLQPLLQHPHLENIVQRLREPWTHYYPRGNAYRQLDYILASQQLAERSKAKPRIVRIALPWRAERYKGERLEDVGYNHPKGSDHAGVVWACVI